MSVSDFERFDFEPAYEAVVDPEFPGDGDWGCPVYGFGRDGELTEPFDSRWGPPVIVQISAGHTWAGSFAAGGLGALRGVFACPSPDHLCAVANGLAYLVDVRHPDKGATLAHDQVTQVLPVAEMPLLVLARSIDLVGIGRNGIEWRSRRLCVDELEIHSATRSGIYCTAENFDKERELVVDPVTGRQARGSLLPAGWPDD